MTEKVLFAYRMYNLCFITDNRKSVGLIVGMVTYSKVKDFGKMKRESQEETAEIIYELTLASYKGKPPNHSQSLSRSLLFCLKNTLHCPLQAALSVQNNSKLHYNFLITFYE